jgi:transposase
VVAPALIPKKAGDRVKTDRRDAGQLARLARSGALTPVSVPTVKAAALCDLSRAREDTLSDCKDATCRRNACLLRHDLRSPGRAHWGPAHRRWLSEVLCPTPAQHLVFPAYVRAVHEPPARLQRLDQARQEHGTSWRLAPGVEACQALRGVQCTVAVTTGAALGDLRRCEPPRALMKLLGRIPSEYSTGERRRPGSITTAGNTPARRGLVEGAWASRYPAKVSRHLPLRREKHPTVIQDIRWKAQVRLCKRSRTLLARGKHANQVVVASARALVGCMGAIATEVPVPP